MSNPRYTVEYRAHSEVWVIIDGIDGRTFGASVYYTEEDATKRADRLNIEGI